MWRGLPVLLEHLNALHREAVSFNAFYVSFALLPIELLQTMASVKHGYWYSRSSEFLGRGLMQTLRWLRMPGDTLFAIGAIGFVLFVFGLGFGCSLKDKALSPSVVTTRSEGA